jgi:mRNA interferase MazF
MDIRITKELIEIFAHWTKKKIHIHASDIRNFPRERQIWWASLGQNIGVEVNGKNEMFERPVLVIKRYSEDASLVVPISSAIREDIYHVSFINHKGENNAVNLSQVRSISSKRFIRKIGKMSVLDYSGIKERLREII